MPRPRIADAAQRNRREDQARDDEQHRHQELGAEADDELDQRESALCVLRPVLACRSH